MKFIKPLHEPIFEDFIHTVDIDADLKGIDSALRQDREGAQKSEEVSNVGGYHSRSFYTGEFRSAPVEELVRGVMWYANRMFREIKADTEVKNYEWWYMINRRGNYNDAHCHGHSSLTAVYYVAAPENCGDIVVMRTDGGMYNPMVRQLSVQVKPEAGRLVLFPGHLVHYVQPSESDEERISMAFNIYTP